MNNLLNSFQKYLLSLTLSPVSRKLYLSDIRRFLSYLGGQPSIDELCTSASYTRYVESLRSLATAPSMLKRTLASLKQFGTFVSLTYSVANPMANISNLNSASQSKDGNVNAEYIKHFTNYLESEHLSPLTIKSYKSDVTRYLDWATANIASDDIVKVLTDKNFSLYLNHLTDSASVIPSTIERKLKSYTRLKSWYLNTYPSAIESDNTKSLFGRGETWLARTPQDQSPDITADSVKNNNSRKIWYPVFNFGSLVTFGILILFIGSLSIFGYRQFSKDVRLTAAFPSTPVTPNRQLSFQGRLEDAGGTPITSATNLTFKLWDDATVGSQLYSSGTCSITPDSDGVFSTQIGSTCGSAITSSVFTENSNVWLEVTVAAETLSPRQPIATVAYALNSETIQGFPISSTVSAVRNTVVPMNQWGEIIVGEQSPRLKGVSGTFQISAPALSFITTAGTNGNISFAPDGTGQINATGNTTSTNFFNVSNAQLTTGSLITGTAANNNSGFKLIDLLSGSSPTSKFSVTDAGNTTIAGDLTISGGNITSALTTDSTLTVTGDFAANGTNNTIGNAITDNIDFQARVMQDSDLIPITATGTNDLGSALLPWDNVYAVALTQNGNTVCDASGNCPTTNQYWRSNLGTLSPITDTYDLLVGANATSSAKAGFININLGTPTATVSAGSAGGAYLNATGTLATTAKQSLTLGDAGTGNVVIAPGGVTALTGVGSALTASGALTVTGTLTANGTLDSNGDVTIADTNIAFDGASTTFTTTGAFTLTPGGATLIGDGGDTLQINSSDWDVSTTGDLSNIGSIGMDGDLTNTQADPSIFLTDTGADDYSINVDANVFNIINATDSRTELSFDGAGGIDLGDNTATKTIHIGGNTASAADTITIGTNGTAADTITIGNTGSGTALALNDDNWNITGAGLANFVSIGAVTAGTGAFTTLTSSGASTIGTGTSLTNTFGSGASSINTIGSVTTPGALTLHGATTLDNTFTVSGSNLTSLGGNLTVTGTAWTATPTISGLITATSGLTANGNLTSNANTVLGNAITDSIDFQARVLQDADLIPITATGTNDLGSALLPWDNVYATSFTQNGNLVCDVAGNNCPATSGTNYWRSSLGALSPLSDSYDLLLGNAATSSAKAGFININLGTPTATVSAGAAGGAYLNATGTLATTAKQSLTLGDANTGNIVLSPGGVTALTGVGANLTTGGTLSLNGFTSGSIVFSGTSGVLSQDNSNFFWDDSNNRLGIGVNTGLLATLDVRSTLGTISVASFSGDTSKATLFVDQSGIGDIFTASKSGATKFVITNAGNVGIGVAAPTNKLEIGGTTSTISNSSGDLTVDSFSGNVVFGTDDDLIPTLGAGSADLGSVSLPWDNLYASNLSYAAAAGTLTLKDNTASAYKIVEGANTYLDITTTNDAESFTLNLPTGGATSHTANLFTANIAQTINIGTGTAIDTINIGTGGTSADDINIGGLATSHLDITGITNFAGGTTYKVDASGNATFLDLQALDTANPGLTVGNGTTGFFKVGGSTISDNSGNLTLDSDSAAITFAADDTTLTASGIATLDTAASTTWDATTLTLGGSATINGGSAAAGTLTLVSSSNASKGNIQFFSSSNTLDSSGNLILAGDVRINGNDIADSAGTNRVTLGATTTLTNTTTTLSGTSTITASSLATLTASSALNLQTTTLTLNSNSTINGGSAANDDLTLQGTSNATRTSSYVLLQPTAGNVGIGTSAPTGRFDITDTSNTAPSFALINNTATTIGNGANTLGVIDLESTSLTTGNFMNIENNALTSGHTLNITTTSTGLVASSALLNLSASGNPAATWTGDLGAIQYITSTDADIDGNALKVGIVGAGAGDGTALNVTTGQTGTSALALRVNDDGTYTDSTPFVVDLAGNVGIGTATPATKLSVVVDDATNTDITNVLTLTHTTSGTATGGSDDSYTKVLLHADGSDGTTTFTDESGKTWTAGGNAQIDTAQSKFGGSAALFDGTGDYVETADNDDFAFGSGDFTIDTWIRPTAGSASTRYFAGQVDSASTATNASFRMMITTGNVINVSVYSGGTVYGITGTIGIPLNSWYHIAFVRDSNTLRLFVDGVADGTNDVTGVTFNNSTYKPAIGRFGEVTTSDFTGSIDEFRVSKGIARWTSNFTPETSAYSYNTGTGIGTGILFRSEDASGNLEDTARISSTLLDATNAAEDSSIIFETRLGGAALARAMRIWHTGDVTMAGWLSQDSNPDIAENIIATDPTIRAGDVVMLDMNYHPDQSAEIYNRTAVIKANEPYSKQILGVISTDAGILLNAPESGINTQKRSADNERPLTLAGRVPVNMDPRSEPIVPGDLLTASDVPGLATKSVRSGNVVGKALQSWPDPTPGADNSQLLLYVQPGYYDPEISLNDDGEITLAGSAVVPYTVETPSGITTKVGAFASATIAKIVAGLTRTNELQVATISPLASGSAITINAPVVIQPPVDSTTPALTVEGEISADSISARSAKLDTLEVKNIIAEHITVGNIDGLEARIASLSAGTTTELSDSDLETITDRIKARLSGSAADLPAPSEATYSAIADTSANNLESSISTSSASIDFATINNYLAVIGTATITELEITSDLYTESINSKTGMIALGDSTLLIDSSGLVAINGDLTVSGKITASELNLEKLSILNESGVEVATIDASGSANLASLTTNMITIASAGDATSSSLLSTSITSNATAGEAILISPNTELVIESKYVTPNSLVYLTPTGNTDNKVVFVKSKTSCPPLESSSSLLASCIPSFTVAIDSPASSDISFNWWIIELKP